MRLDRVKVISEMARQELLVPDLAEKARLGPATITGVRRGMSCRYETAVAICKALGKTLEELVEEQT